MRDSCTQHLRIRMCHVEYQDLKCSCNLYTLNLA